MGMNVGSPDSSGEEEVVSTINTTPLVDVMLVLLIIFLITIPVVTQSVNLALPKETNQVRKTKPENIELAVTKDGEIYWNTANVPNVEALKDRLRAIATMDPQPEVHIRGDEKTRYESVGRVILAAQQVGIVKVSFVTEPPARGG
jgi:biopolymer transport protein ExbD